MPVHWLIIVAEELGGRVDRLRPKFILAFSFAVLCINVSILMVWRAWCFATICCRLLTGIRSLVNWLHSVQGFHE